MDITIKEYSKGQYIATCYGLTDGDGFTKEDAILTLCFRNLEALIKFRQSPTPVTINGVRYKSIFKPDDR